MDSQIVDGENDHPLIVHLICSIGFYGAERVVASRCNQDIGSRQHVLCLTKEVDSVVDFKRAVIGSTFEVRSGEIRDAVNYLLKTLKSNPNTILHTHGYKAIVIASIVSLFSKVSMIHTQHGFTKKTVKSRLYGTIDKTLCCWGNVDEIICVSKDILKEYTVFGVKNSKLHYLPNAIDLKVDSLKERDKSKVAESFNLSLATPIVLFAGRLSGEKDPLKFVDIVKKVKNEADITAVIAGDGPLKECVKREIEGFSYIHFLGFTKNIFELLLISDITVICSKTEGTPMIALESMLYKSLVVASHVGGLPSIIENNVNGLLIDNRDTDNFSRSIVDLLQSKEQLNALKERAFSRVNSEFDSSKQNTYYHELYKKYQH